MTVIVVRHVISYCFRLVDGSQRAPFFLFGKPMADFSKIGKETIKT